MYPSKEAPEENKTAQTIIDISLERVCEMKLKLDKIEQWATTQNYGTANMSYHKAQDKVLEILRGE